MNFGKKNVFKQVAMRVARNKAFQASYSRHEIGTNVATPTNNNSVYISDFIH